MAIIETKFSPQESLRRIHNIVEMINKHLKEHALHNVFHKVTSDIHVLGDEDHLKAMLSKFDDASLKQFYIDARNLGHLAKTHPDYIPHIKESLTKIEYLLKDMRKAEIMEIRKARFLGRMANHLSREVKGVEKEVDKTQNQIAKQLNSYHKTHSK